MAATLSSTHTKRLPRPKRQPDGAGRRSRGGLRPRFRAQVRRIPLQSSKRLEPIVRLVNAQPNPPKRIDHPTQKNDQPSVVDKVPLRHKRQNVPMEKDSCAKYHHVPENRQEGAFFQLMIEPSHQHQEYLTSYSDARQPDISEQQHIFTRLPSPAAPAK